MLRNAVTVNNSVVSEERAEVGDSRKIPMTIFANSTTLPPSSSPHKKRVRFPEDENQLAATFAACNEAWRVDPEMPNYAIVDAYAKACLRSGLRPLSSIIEQLSKMTVSLAKTKIPAIILKGTQLTKADIEALECVFKYCQTYHLSFENTNLDNKSLAYLLEVLDYYAPFNELCLARNNRITGDGFRLITNFISKYPYLNWLDLRGISLNLTCARYLTRGLIAQRDEARKIVFKFLNTCTGQEIVNPDASRDAELDPDAFRLTFGVFLPNSTTSVEVNTLSGALQRLPPLCIRGLHLGETGLSGAALFDVTNGIRVAGHLRDLRLPRNKLGAHDVEVMVQMLRYYPGLQVLDLSHNDLGDEGYRFLSSALSHPCYPTNFAKTSTDNSITKLCCNIRRLYLAGTGLRPTGAKIFATCFSALSFLSHLELSDNPSLGCQGVIALRGALQVHTRHKLVYIGLARCGLACQGAIALAEVLGDVPRALRRIDFTGNHIAEAGLMAILKSITLCSGLVQLQGLEDNRPIRPSSIGENTLQTGKSKNTNAPASSSTATNGISTRFSMFKFPRSSLTSTNMSGELTENSVCTRRRSAGRSMTLSEPSQLSLDLLQSIHSQLASNVDKRIASHQDNYKQNKHPIPQPVGKRQEELRFFRGYVRFPPSIARIRSESDPRHLDGDTSESEISSDSESDCSMSSVPPLVPEVLTRQSCVDNDLLRSDFKKQK